MGYKMVNHAVGAVLVNFKATKDMFTHLKETGKSGMDPAVYQPVRKEVEEASGFPEFTALRRRQRKKAESFSDGMINVLPPSRKIYLCRARIC
jgi:hypothetical protein